ncbi:uncharacterized protein AKAW2_52030A [Aspergillus luchuensis]|uniref:Uncharacterized protein n=1 Tax=Aspergillus kawachii TaxID=1069201 RepID=A0A7R8A0I1_ASPKA|nr:uncharacterized protein AKAW2_52030A [Aspergillus luchuensis]BCS01689.1 hypothetical protein AKAW2_52030A [Aspergillus luchuensis]
MQVPGLTGQHPHRPPVQSDQLLQIVLPRPSHQSPLQINSPSFLAPSHSNLAATYKESHKEISIDDVRCAQLDLTRLRDGGAVNSDRAAIGGHDDLSSYPL